MGAFGKPHCDAILLHELFKKCLTFLMLLKLSLGCINVAQR